jgi:L-alanine-DL-glutamate epimerase-like enolase superfamily enzyme
VKITDVRAIRLRASIPAEGQVTSRSGVRESRTTALVRIDTDRGIHGYGSCSGNGAIVQFIVEQVIKPIVVGMDPAGIDALWQKLYFGPRARQLGLRGIGFVALSGFDVALWDIRGKAEGVPICKLLSEKPRGRIEVYATALYPDEIKNVVDRAVRLAELGYRGIKMKIGFEVAGDMERVRAVREAVGQDFPLMSDANMGYDLATAERAGRALAEMGIGWLEEPMFFADAASHARLKAAVKVPIALGENLHTVYDFEQFIARGAVDILQPDVARAGGISEIVRIGALAESHHLPVSLHTWGDGVALAASLHLSAALKNAIVMELDTTHNPLRTEILRRPLQPVNGSIAPPAAPGLGIELDENALQRYAFSGAE